MSKLRKKLRENASKQLAVMIADTEKRAREIATDGVEPEQLLKLAAGGRTASIKAKVIGQMVNHAEEQLYDKYNDQPDLPMEPKAKVSSVS